MKYNTYLLTNKSLSPINSLNQKVKIDRSAELGIVGIVNTLYIHWFLSCNITLKLVQMRLDNYNLQNYYCTTFISTIIYFHNVVFNTITILRAVVMSCFHKLSYG